MKFKSCKFFKKDLEILLLALRFAQRYEAGFIDCYTHCEDQSATIPAKNNIKKFLKLDKKIQHFLQEENHENS